MKADPMCAAAPARTALALLACTLAGCAATSSPGHQAGEPSWPRLALAPAALGCGVSVQQQLTVQPPGEDAQQLDALLQVDAQAVRLALFHLGQRMGSLHWDGLRLQAQLSPWWPSRLVPAQVLGDMQLALWPLAAVAAALPARWSVVDADGVRRLAESGQARVEVRGTGADSFEIVYPQAAWRLRIASPGGMQPCAAAGAAP